MNWLTTLIALERSRLVVTMTYISSLYGTSFIASISFYVLVVGDLWSLLLVCRGVAIDLQFSMSRDFKVFKLVETNSSFLLVSRGFWPLLGFQGKMWILLNSSQIPTIGIFSLFLWLSSPWRNEKVIHV
jgi:hypothetical protein